MRIAVGVSGGGRSLENLLKLQKNLPYKVVAVFSSALNLGANAIAKREGIPLLIEDFSKANFENSKKSLYKFLELNKVDLVALAGFLKLLPTDAAWKNKIINIHPALLPKYGGKGMHGLHVHQAVFAAGESISGATIHYVNEKYDEGAIVSQIRVPVSDLATPSAIADRVFQAECKLLPWTITQFKLGELPKDQVAILNELGELTT